MSFPDRRIVALLLPILVATLLTGGTGGLHGQELMRLDGRLVESGTTFGLASGWVQVQGGTRVAAGVDGGFRVDGLAPGSYVLTAGAYGYGTRRIELSLRADTTLLIELEPAPVPLDSLRVEGQTVRLRGEVLEGGTERRLMDVEVDVEGQEPIWTDAAGRFGMDIAAGPPVRVTVRHFGYLPVRTVISTFTDTMMMVELESDRAVQRMIEVQVRRLEQRARPLVSTTMPAIDRGFIRSRGHATAMDLVVERYGPQLSKIECLVIDEEQQVTFRDVARAGGGRSIGWGGRGDPGPVLEPLTHMLAPEIERMEVLEFGHLPKRWMLRVYTRDFIREMVARTGRVKLTAPRIIPGAGDSHTLCT